MANKKTTIGNVCFLIDKTNKKILFLERAFEPMKGMYTGVGGKTRFDEDINLSCVREIKEETGFTAKKIELKGIIKTLLDGHNSSWLLFVYTCNDFEGKQIDCPEGKLEWVKTEEVFSIKHIGFIREILPFVLKEDSIMEGTIVHDSEGEVISKRIIEVK